MKKITITLSLTAISLFLFSCNTTPNEKSEEQTETVTHEDHHHHGDELEALELNNGEKWKVDADMMVAIRNMENDVNSFTNGEQKHYESLVEKLQTNIKLLTSSCTMKGKSHDELHKWLLPHMAAVKNLSAAKDDTEAAKQLNNIQTSLATFNQYFE